MIPRHIALILDGNGRWAEQRGLDRNEGHREGEKTLWDVAVGAVAIGIEWLTVFVFSTENWRRPKEEVQFLIWFNRDVMLARRAAARDKGMRLRFLGRRGSPIPDEVIDTMVESEEMTLDNDLMTLSFCFNYGGRSEIVDAATKIAELTRAGEIDLHEIDEALFARYLYAPDMPDPDLVIRTSAEKRTSNFLLWETAYSEWMFPDLLWPEFSREHLYEAIARYQGRDRRFGGITDENR